MSRTATDAALSVDDDGRGFDQVVLACSDVRGRLGLRALEERLRAAGGTLTIDSAPDKGTRVLARVPLNGSGSRFSRDHDTTESGPDGGDR